MFSKAELLQRAGYRCWYCGAPIYDAAIAYGGLQRTFLISWDHVIPRSHARSVQDNKRPVCKPCNKLKATYSIEEYRNLVAHMLATNDYRGKLPYIASDLVNRRWQLKDGYLTFYFELIDEKALP